MKPLELSAWIQEQRKNIDEELTQLEITHPSRNNYAYAYGRTKTVMITAAMYAEQLDPSFGLGEVKS